MITYLLKSATCLGLLLAFYHFVLEKEKMHNFNRFYLLGSLLFSFLVPLYIIYTDVTPVVLETVQTATNFYPTNEIPTVISTDKPIDYVHIIIGVYCLISALLLIRFGRNLFKMIVKIKRNEKVNYKKANLVLVNDTILPHTFWKYIFINKSEYENANIEKELFTHELTHVTQKHTIDVLLLELTQALFWINPFFILLKKAVQLNHEFLADETVITQHKNTFQYQHLLLNKAAWKNEYYLASNLNYLVTKKRLKMMTTQSSPTKILLKKLAIIPLLTGFVFLFAQRVEAQEIIEVVEEPVETIVEEKQNISKNDFEKYKVLVEKVKNSEIIKQKDVVWMTSTYRKMSDEQRKSVENIFHYIVADVSLSKRKVSGNQLKKWQNKDEYAIWVDGKSKENSILKNYKESDFSYYSESFVHKNARSKKFPQNYQVSVYTNKYFKELVDKNSKLEEVVEVVEQKGNLKIIEIKEQRKKQTQKKEYIDSPIQKYNYPSSNGSKQSFTIDKNSPKPHKNHNEEAIIDIRLKLKDVNALEIIYHNAGANSTGFKLINGILLYYVNVNNKTKFYNKEGKLFDENGKQISTKKANASEIIPENYVKKVFYKGDVFCEFFDDKPFLNETKLKSSAEQKKASIEEMQEYKRLILEVEKKTVIKVKTVTKLKAIYKSMSKEQQNSVKNIDEVLAKLPPPPKPDWLFTYQRLAHRIKTTSKNRKENLIYLEKIYKEKLSETEKAKVNAPQLLIPPPPPKPNATKEEILEAKKAYEVWKKRAGNRL
ncbi:M56 family metallopeptidase [Polaribacter sp.]|uniref:M56 family metallopeptidase n=1 Tax=Polaribacter sp. TaxID=1920175 RepID=UPI003F6A722E